MYLIDRGELLMQMMHKFHYELPDGCNNSLYDDVIKVIEDAPLIEVEPVRHGWWGTHSDRPDSLICSVCKCGFDMWKHDPHNYCPNCGAKMDLEE